MMVKRLGTLLWISFFLFIVVHTLGVYLAKKKSLQDDISSVSTKIIFEFAQGSNAIVLLSQNSSFKSYLDTRLLSDKELASDIFVDILKSNSNYDQIRYINAKGIETIRVDATDNGPRVVPTSELQDKSTRYYYLDTMKLDEGEIFVSPLDLNVEDGRIEYPEVPTLRMATPVFKSDGEIAGIIIINYDATVILNDIIEKGSDRPYLHLILANSDGFFIHGPSPETNWGFMYAGREDETFEKYYPHGWQKIKQMDTGIALSREGAFFFRKVYPIQGCQIETLGVCQSLSYYSKRLSTRDFHLIVVAHATLPMLYEVIAKQILLQPFLLGIAFIMIYVTARRIRG